MESREPVGGVEPLANSPARLAAGMVSQFALVAALMPLLPVYLGNLGLSSGVIALLLALQAVMSLIAGQIAGWLADSRLRRTTMMVGMALAASVVQALFPLIPPTLPLLALGVAALSVFMGPRISLLNALALESRRGEELFGRIRLVGSIGFAILTVVIGRLADHPALTVTVMWPILVFFELFFVATILMLKDHAPRERARRTGVGPLSFRAAQGLLLRNPTMVWFLVFSLIVHTVAQPFHILQAKLLSDAGSTSLFIMACFSFAALAETVVFFYGNAILARVRLMALLATIPVAMAVRCAMISLWPVPWVVLASNALHMITFGLAYLCGVLFIHRESPPSLKSSAQSLFGIVFSVLSGLIGNLAIWGLLAVLESPAIGMTDAMALRVTYGIGGAFALVAYLAWVPMKRQYEAKHRVSGVWIR